MPILNFSNDCKLEISPIMDDPKIFVGCTIKEAILGHLPDLTLTLKTSKAPCKLNDSIKGSIIDKDGMPTTFDGYVYSINSANDKWIIKILCVKPDFVNKEFNNSFKSMNYAIEELYFDKKKD